MPKKLVRDKIIEIILSKGEKVDFYHAEDEEYFQSLLDKLIEESEEVGTTSDDLALKEELADLLEVIYAICSFKKLDLDEIDKIRMQKKDKRGGFEKKIILKS